ncbi:MAG: hypothetical protein AB1758_35165, partial [Candidatus Eremiobacterota bacterium]
MRISPSAAAALRPAGRPASRRAPAGNLDTFVATTRSIALGHLRELSGAAAGLILGLAVGAAVSVPVGLAG